MAPAEHACNTHIGVATHGTKKRTTGAAAPTEHARDAPERAGPRVGAQQGACARHEEVSATDHHGAQKNSLHVQAQDTAVWCGCAPVSPLPRAFPRRRPATPPPVHLGHPRSAGALWRLPSLPPHSRAGAATRGGRRGTERSSPARLFVRAVHTHTERHGRGRSFCRSEYAGSAFPRRHGARVCPRTLILAI